MATGWAPDGAVQDQIDASIADAVRRARDNLQKGAGLNHCEECSQPIPEGRRLAVTGVRLCVECQKGRDADRSVSLFNRRGSKDSQLR